MIAFPGDMPNNCESCPCFAMYTATSVDYEKVAVQYCNAKHATIKVHVEDKPFPDDWHNSSRQKWCPLMTV